MRLWHYKLLPFLPKDMLVSQWREIVAIKRQWEKGTLKHRLVSYVKEYNKAYFLNYAELVLEEFKKRGINYNFNLYKEIQDFCSNGLNACDNYPEHNDRYLKQCYYNLQEKADRGIISEEEWKEIKECVEKCI